MSKRYWKVYANCVCTPKPVTEISEYTALELIENEVYRWDREYQKVEDYRKKVGEEGADAEVVASIMNDYLLEAYDMFEAFGDFGCGDYELIISDEKPERSNVCTDDCKALDTWKKGQN